MEVYGGKTMAVREREEERDRVKRKREREKKKRQNDALLVRIGLVVV